jgi:two-component system cell cycle response regulator
VELLKQNLIVESDLQSFAGLVLESVGSCQGSVFSATRALLGLLEKLRTAGVAAGNPLPVTLSLSGQHLLVEWDNQSMPVARLSQVPPQAAVEHLHEHLQGATVMTDPDLLRQRNAEMMRHFEQVRARNEKELAALQQTLENGRVELRELLHQAETDPLTGLYNRRAFDARLVQMFRHIMRQRNSPLSLLLLDLDHFKQINDRFGHQFGDTYLNKMADVLRGIIREDVDYAFRFGGDEFAVVIYADYALACEKAQQALQMMEGRVSIGIATINAATPDDLAVDEFFRHADDALYQAKNRGRGRIVVQLCDALDSTVCTSFCSDQLLPDEYRV